MPVRLDSVQVCSVVCCPIHSAAEWSPLTECPRSAVRSAAIGSREGLPSVPSQLDSAQQACSFAWCAILRRTLNEETIEKKRLPDPLRWPQHYRTIVVCSWTSGKRAAESVLLRIWQHRIGRSPGSGRAFNEVRTIRRLEVESGQSYPHLQDRSPVHGSGKSPDRNLCGCFNNSGDVKIHGLGGALSARKLSRASAPPTNHGRGPRGLITERYGLLRHRRKKIKAFLAPGFSWRVLQPLVFASRVACC